ncbi:hypothetical protein BDF22DRAFT_740651 [Syncephalis plumigaleata]|nr:hypothetical protein BDF22DRAFT_740651 [Syncephalis plumigaleata]
MSEDENKEARYELRARCLDIWLKITEQQPLATFQLVDGSNVTAVLKSTHAQETHYRVGKLNTPIGQYPEALLRHDDVQSISLTL